MKTKLPESITTVDEAKAFIKELYDNGEAFHPEDDATDIIWDLPSNQVPTLEECVKLNELMTAIYALPECKLKHRQPNSIPYMDFDPCGYLSDLDGHVME